MALKYFQKTSFLKVNPNSSHLSLRVLPSAEFPQKKTVTFPILCSLILVNTLFQLGRPALVRDFKPVTKSRFSYNKDVINNKNSINCLLVATCNDMKLQWVFCWTEKLNLSLKHLLQNIVKRCDRGCFTSLASSIIMYYFHPTYVAAMFPKSHNNKMNKKFTSCPHLCPLHTAIMLL